MIGNKLAILSLLLVGLSLSSNLLMAARRNRHMLYRLLYETSNPFLLREAFQDLGGTFQIYADLDEITEENCTPERILFANPKSEYLGEGAQLYVHLRVETQRRLCEQTFFRRLNARYTSYNENWYGKEDFQQFISFVQPWPTLNFETLEIADWIPLNMEAYMDWREHQTPRIRSRVQARRLAANSSLYVYGLLAGFASSFRANANFRPELDWEQAHAIVLGMIAEAVIEVSTDLCLANGSRLPLIGAN